MRIFLAVLLLFNALVQMDKQTPEPEPFSKETVEELARYRAVLETSIGPITIELLPEKAPHHVRNFLRLAEEGVYDGTTWHRVIPGFLIEAGLISTRSKPPSEKAMRYVRTLEPEPNDIPHVTGTVSMANGDNSDGVSTTFFICTVESRHLDGKRTAFGKVVEGMRVVKAIENLPTNGERPLTRINLSRVRVERIPD
jgi:peptidyl-prolyl cis-trans isomerase B (cyclophilin B)